MAFDEIASIDAISCQSLTPAPRELEAGQRRVSIARLATRSENKSRNHQPISAPRCRISNQAQAYIDTHYADAVHIEDLCRVTGVGARTLQRCFRDCLSITVSNYLKTVRLEAARRELAASRVEETSVTTIAMKNGCTHLGRFSVEFRERYGVSPRQLLASRPADNRISHSRTSS